MSLLHSERAEGHDPQDLLQHILCVQVCVGIGKIPNSSHLKPVTCGAFLPPCLVDNGRHCLTWREPAHHLHQERVLSQPNILPIPDVPRSFGVVGPSSGLFRSSPAASQPPAPVIVADLVSGCGSAGSHADSERTEPYGAQVDRPTSSPAWTGSFLPDLKENSVLFLGVCSKRRQIHKKLMLTIVHGGILKTHPF